MASLNPVSGSLGIDRAKHLLRRLSFGYNRQQLIQFASLTIDEAISQLFDNIVLPAAPLTPDGVELMKTVPETIQEAALYQSYFRSWWLGRLYKENTILEKLTFFLHTVITNKSEVVEDYKAYYYQTALFRQYIINDFADTNPLFNRYTELIKKICIDNAMLIFLDGRFNIYGRPNENFARELFELFTLGKGETKGAGDYTNYTEKDIKEAAKVLTGWTNDSTYQNIDPDTGIPVGKVKGSDRLANQHDNSTKTLTNAFSTADFPIPEIKPKPELLNAGRATLESCKDEISQLIDIIFAKPEAELFLMRKIYRFFVHYNITQEIEDDILMPLAAEFKTNGFRLRPILEKLFKSEFFFEAGGGADDDKFGAIIKSPLDLIFGTLRYFKIDIGIDSSEEFYQKMNYIDSLLPGMQFNFLNPYDVAGYEAYHQAPGYNRNWITTTSLANRYDFINKLFTNNADKPIKVDLYAWVNNPESGITNELATTGTVVGDEVLAKDLIKFVASDLLTYTSENTGITEERYNYFGLYHLSGLSFDNWVYNWNSSVTNMSSRDDVRARLNNLYNALMQSPEYQLF